MLQAVALSTDKKHPSVLSDDLISVQDAGAAVPITFRLPLSAKGKQQTSLRVPLTSKVSDLKRALRAQEGFDRPAGDLELFVQGEELTDERTMLSYEKQGVKGIVQVRGGYKEVLIATAVIPTCFPVRWSVHSTVTDLAKAVYRRLKDLLGVDAVDLDKVRVRHKGTPVSLKCAYRYRDQALAWGTTLARLGLGQPGDPCTVKFRRSCDGAISHITLHLSGDTTISEVHEAVVATERRDKEACDDDGWVNGVLRPQSEKHPRRVAHAQQAGHRVWDDDDDSVAPAGRKRVYLYTPECPDYHRTADLDKGSVYMAYHPPTRPPPTFRSIEEDHTIPHLSDLGILPDTQLELSFWSEQWKIWSSDVTHLVIDEPPCYDVTVKTCGGMRVRIPVAERETFEEVMLKLWCATGGQPQDTALMAEDGRMLDEFRCMLDYGLLPETTLYCSRRPRPWDSPEAKERARRPPRVNADLAVP